MGLRSLIQTELVKVSDEEGFPVRGVSPNDAIILYHRHRGELSAMFDQFAAEAKQGKNVVVTDLASAGVQMVGGAPLIMAEIIVLAMGMKPDSDEFDDEVAAAIDLPAAVQMDALQKIGGLTFTSDMPPEKFLAVVVKLAGGTAAALKLAPAA